MTFDTVKDIIIEKLDVDPALVTIDTDIIKDLEADSLDAVEVILAVEEEYGLEIPDEDAEGLITVRDIVEYVDSNK